MKKAFFISIFTLFAGILFGQLKSPVRELFFGINLNASRKAIYNQLASDKRFFQKGYIETDSLSPFYHGEFHGLSFDKGLVEAKPDSIEISLNWLKISRLVKNGEHETINNLIFFSKYYYSSNDIAKKEYQQIIDLVSRKNSDTSHQERYIHFPVPIESTRFNFRKPAYQLEIMLFNFDATHSELHLSFIRKE
ncbi:MAG: hypothetical protein QM791_17900 [Ferruginibacter sp.]